MASSFFSQAKKNFGSATKQAQSAINKVLTYLSRCASSHLPSILLAEWVALNEGIGVGYVVANHKALYCITILFDMGIFSE